MGSFFRTLGVRLASAVVVLTAAPFLRAVNVSPDLSKIEPVSTRVLLLTPIDATKAAATAGPLRRQIVRIRQQREFLSRHFAVLGETAAAKASAIPPGLKSADLNDRSAETLDQLAARSGADWVVSITLREVAVDDLDPPEISSWFIHCTVMLQIRDARHHVWLANRPYTGRIFAGGTPPELLLDAVDATTEQALGSVLWPFTVVIPVSRDGRIVDYLKGATEAVRGKPGEIFSGWNANDASAKDP